eukprot:1138446-Pelagomonas_calceolata.AAC.1
MFDLLGMNSKTTSCFLLPATTPPLRKFLTGAQGAFHFQLTRPLWCFQAFTKLPAYDRCYLPGSIEKGDGCSPAGLSTIRLPGLTREPASALQVPVLLLEP